MATGATKQLERGRRDRRVGTVVSDKGDKTIRVQYEFVLKHTKYGKYFTRSSTLHTHDEKNEARRGDIVEVEACRRMSKMKCWRLLKIVDRRSAAFVSREELEAVSRA
ncbi:MAG: 30S ribosomal protein S17 [Planctomycetes bacterium]|nr:30S ribosomal protein S17 [Planctomycetota bacterium]MBI3836015.1 30S ribosomal protein S17 [Planctomycetota bacterium]